MEWHPGVHDFVVIDTETTGTDPEKDAVVEIALVGILNRCIRSEWVSRVKPPVAIPPQASGIHHLTDADVRSAPSLEDLVPSLLEKIGSSVLVAHNAAFDRSFLPMLSDRPWVCSWRLARHVWPEIEHHGNQALRYWLGIDTECPREQRLAHSALDDARITAKVFLQAARRSTETENVRSMKDLIELADRPILLKTIPFGKHKGQEFRSLPADYVAWLKKNAEDPDVRYTLSHLGGAK